MAICSICKHPNTPDIDAALAEGQSVRLAASKFALSKSAVARHRVGCLAPKLAAAARLVAPTAVTRSETERARAIASGQVVATMEDIVTLSGLVDRIGRSLERLDNAADVAASDGSHTALAALSAQLHRGIEVVARLQGMADIAEAGGPKFSVVINLPSTPQGSDG